MPELGRHDSSFFFNIKPLSHHENNFRFHDRHTGIRVCCTEEKFYRILPFYHAVLYRILLVKPFICKSHIRDYTYTHIVSSTSNVYVTGTLRFCCVYVICIWRVMFFDTLCVSFSFVFFPIYCFVAAIYANKDVYTRRGMRVHTFIHSFIHIRLLVQQLTKRNFAIELK